MTSEQARELNKNKSSYKVLRVVGSGAFGIVY